MLGAAVDSVISNIESEIADKATGNSEITDQDIAEYNIWKTDIEQERAGWDARLLVKFPLFDLQFTWSPSFD
jgi:hypothetical protein